MPSTGLKLRLIAYSLMVGDDDDLMIQLGVGSNAKNEMERALQIIGQEGVDKIKLKLVQAASSRTLLIRSGSLAARRI